MSEEDLVAALAELEEDCSNIRRKMNTLRNEWLSEETKLIGLNLKKDKIKDQIRRIRNS